MGLMQIGLGFPSNDRWVVGLEEDGDQLRVYLDARYLGRYVLLEGEDAERMRRMWAGSYGGHLLATFDGHEVHQS